MGKYKCKIVSEDPLNMNAIHHTNGVRTAMMHLANKSRCECTCSNHPTGCYKKNKLWANDDIHGSIYYQIANKTWCSNQCEQHPDCSRWEFSTSGRCVLKHGAADVSTEVDNTDTSVTSWAGVRASECIHERTPTDGVESPSQPEGVREDQYWCPVNKYMVRTVGRFNTNDDAHCEACPAGTFLPIARMFEGQKCSAGANWDYGSNGDKEGLNAMPHRRTHNYSAFASDFETPGQQTWTQAGVEPTVHQADLKHWQTPGSLLMWPNGTLYVDSRTGGRSQQAEATNADHHRHEHAGW